GKRGLLRVVRRENTHRICWVSFAQAKLTWLGLDATFGFWQAMDIWLRTFATLAGQLALPPETFATRIAPARTRARPIVMARQCARQRRRPRLALCRPRLMRISGRSSGPLGSP